MRCISYCIQYIIAACILYTIVFGYISESLLLTFPFLSYLSLTYTKQVLTCPVLHKF